MANDLTINPAKIDTAAAALIGSGPWHIEKIIWNDVADGEDLIIENKASSGKVLLIWKHTTATDGAQAVIEGPFFWKDFAVTTLDGGNLYIYRKAGADRG